MKIAIASFILLMAAIEGRTDTLETSRYKITVDDQSPEGYVTSNNVNFFVLNQKTRQSISGKGRTVHRTGADGVTPSGFIGYEFTGDRVRYFIYVDGKLRVFFAGSLIYDEAGVWTYERGSRPK